MYVYSCPYDSKVEKDKLVNHVKPFSLFQLLLCTKKRFLFIGITVQERKPKYKLNDYERSSSKGEWHWMYTVM